MTQSKLLQRTLQAGLTVALTVLTAGTSALAADAAPPLVQTNAPWVGSASIGLTVTRGNSENLLFTGAAKIGRKDAKNEIEFGADGAYGETTDTQTEVTTKNSAMAHAYGQYNRLFSERLYGYVRLDGLHDAVADIHYRFTLSPGIGYYFIKRPNTFLRGEVGPGIVHEKTDDGTDTYATVRFAERFEHKFNDSVKMWQSCEYLPQVDLWRNYIINFEIGVEAALNKTFSLLTYLQDSYDNVPVAGRKHNDLKLVAALGAKF